MHQYLIICDLSTLKYFLAIEFTYRSGKLVLNQHKYVLDIVIEVKLLGRKPYPLTIDSKLNFWDSTSPLLIDVHAYFGLVGKLVYLAVIHLGITYIVGLLSQFMYAPQEIYWHAALCFIAYLMHTLEHGLLYLRNGHLCVEVYFNSSYARNRDDRKSIS